MPIKCRALHHLYPSARIKVDSRNPSEMFKAPFPLFESIYQKGPPPPKKKKVLHQLSYWGVKRSPRDVYNHATHLSFISLNFNKMSGNVSNKNMQIESQSDKSIDKLFLWQLNIIYPKKLKFI